MRAIWLAALTMSAVAVAAPEKMQGVQNGAGGTLAVQEMPVPKPAAGEVLSRCAPRA
jgi:hypothetical protein